MRKKRMSLSFLALALPISLLLTSCNSGAPESGPSSEPFSSDISEPSGEVDRPSDGFVDKHSDGTPVMSYDVAISGRVPADQVQAPGDVYTPEESTPSDKVVISGVTVQAGPDDAIVIEGTGFTQDNQGQKVWVYSQTTETDGKKYEAQVLAADETTITAVVPKEAPYSAYGVSVENADGESAPVYVNTPQLWWINETNANPGETVHIYGQNLSSENGTETSYIYLRLGGENASDESIPAQVVEANPYRVSFKVPEGLKTGYQYEVWLHNGHGGNEGWTYAPQYLTILNVPQNQWNGNRINVVDYGADPEDESNDDTDAIEAALEAAQRWDTVYFPAGTYSISREIKIDRNPVRLMGDGKDKTVIVTSGNSDANTFNVTTTPVEIRDMAFKAARKEKGAFPFFYIRGDGYDTGTPNILIEGCYFELLNSSDGQPLDTTALQIYGTKNIVIRNNSFLNPSTLFGQDVAKLFYSNNDVVGNFVHGRYDGTQQVHLRNAEQVDISNNRFISLDKLEDPDGDMEVGDQGVNRSIVIHGIGRQVYVAHNSMERAGTPQDNSGEQVMFEAPYTDYIGPASAMDDLTLTFDDPHFAFPGKGTVVTIVYGTGKTQSRQVVSSKGNVLTLDSPWTIPPDETSVFAVGLPFMDAVVYANSMEGTKNFVEDHSAGTGVNMWGSMRNFFVKDNTFSNYHQGMMIASFVQMPGYGADLLNAQCVWSIVENNTMYNVRNGINIYMFPWDKTDTYPCDSPVYTLMNTVIRRNTVDSTVFATFDKLAGLGGHGIVVGTIQKDYVDFPEWSFWNRDFIHTTVLEHNRFSHTIADGIRLEKHQSQSIVRDNTFTDIGGETVGYGDHAEQAVVADGAA